MGLKVIPIDFKKRTDKWSSDWLIWWSLTDWIKNFVTDRWKEGLTGWLKIKKWLTDYKIARLTD